MLPEKYIFRTKASSRKFWAWDPPLPISDRRIILCRKHYGKTSLSRKPPHPEMVVHMNGPHNGVPVPNARHNGSHPQYSDKIRDELLRWNGEFPNATPDQAAQKLRQWQQALKNQIENSTHNINDIIPPQIPPL